jgi:hypothetical protein
MQARLPSWAQMAGVEMERDTIEFSVTTSAGYDPVIHTTIKGIHLLPLLQANTHKKLCMWRLRNHLSDDRHSSNPHS